MNPDAAVQIESVTTYVRSINQFPRIKRDHELELGDKIQHGTPVEREAAINELVTGNLRLVVKIAHDLKFCGLGFQDLVAEGNLGLLTAAKRFDPEKCPKFGAYASFWIKQAMRIAIATQARAIKLPPQVVCQLYKIEQAIAAFQKEHGRAPMPHEIAENTDLSLDVIKKIQHSATYSCSLDERINDEENITFGDMLSYETEDPQEDDDRDQLLILLKDNLKCLPDRARLAVELFYGFECPAYPIRIVAQEIGMSTRKAECYIAKAVETLKDLMKKKGITAIKRD